MYCCHKPGRGIYLPGQGIQGTRNGYQVVLRLPGQGMRSLARYQAVITVTLTCVPFLHCRRFRGGVDFRVPRYPPRDKKWCRCGYAPAVQAGWAVRLGGRAGCRLRLPARRHRRECREVELSVRGMTCAACAARVEKKLSALDDVAAAVNFATGKATVTVPASVPAARLIEAVEQAGYGAELARPRRARAGRRAGGAGADAARVAYLRRRLIVALVFFVPLSDLSVLLSLFPWSRFPGWQWVLVVLPCRWRGGRRGRSTPRRSRTPGTAPRRWTRWCRWASRRRAAGRCTRCSSWTAGRPG